MYFDQTIAYYYPLIITIIGSSLVGLIAGCLGPFVLLRKQSLLGDTISHASLPGIVLALIISQQKDPALLLIGGAIAGGIGTLLTMLIAATTTLHKDTILGIILSSFFGMGLLFISLLQKYAYADQALINKFLFGNASILLLNDLHIVIIMGCIIITAIALLWKEFTMFSFDTHFTHSLGYSTTIIEMVSTALLVFTIVVGLQTVGVILMSSLLIAPAASARQWTNKVSSMVIISGCIGAGASTLGAYVSMLSHIPSGPMIVLVLSSIVCISLLFAPKRGLLWSPARSKQ